MRRAALVLLFGCSGTTELVGDGGTLPGLESIEVTPADALVVVDDLAVQQTVELVAVGHFAGGEMREITGEVEWGVDNDAPGGFIERGVWRSSNAAGGPVVVEARSGSVAGTAAIRVRFEPVLDDPSFPPPQGVDDLFDSTVPVVAAGAPGVSIRRTRSCSRPTSTGSCSSGTWGRATTCTGCASSPSGWT